MLSSMIEQINGTFNEMDNQQIFSVVIGTLTLYYIYFYVFFTTLRAQFSFRYYYLRAYSAFFNLYDFIFTNGCKKKKKVWFNDPSNVAENRLDTHTQLRMLDSVENVLFEDGNIETDSFLFSNMNASNIVEKFNDLNNSSRWTSLLDGDDWLFFLKEKPLPEDLSFSKIDYDDSSWSNIKVPLCWERNGFGQTIYTNIAYPELDKYIFKRPIVSYEKNETGLYRKYFQLPNEWNVEDRYVTILFHAIGPACRFYVNNVYIGMSKDSFTGTEFDISFADLKFGEGVQNVLAIEVVRWGDSHFLEDQDQWWFSGIHRSVELQCRPVLSMQNIRITTMLEKPCYSDDSNAQLNIDIGFWLKDAYEDDDVLILDERSGGGNYSIRYVLYGINGALIADMATDLDDFTDDCMISIDVESPYKWCAERPMLYTLGLELIKNNEEIVQGEVFRVGFRNVEIVDGNLRVNGKAVTICGANRHEHSAANGKTVSAKETLIDLILMKRKNFNAVRCSHYPNAFHLYDMANEIGLYVCDEGNIETHGFTLSSTFSLLACLPEWKNLFLSRVQSMARRSINYPCVIIHSLGNESGNGPNLEACSAWLRAFDPTRPVQYEGGRDHGDAVLMLGNGQGPHSLTDIVCPMYHSAKQIESTVQERRETRPLILCEYTHAMGNSNGNLSHYFDLFWSRLPQHKQLQGGFVWDWIDQGLEYSEGLGYGYGGDFGPNSGKGDKQFCINGVCFPDRTGKPALEEFKYLQSRVVFSLMQDDDDDDEVSSLPTICVLNRHDHLDLSHLKFEWAVANSSGVYVARGVAEVENPLAGPFESTEFTIPFDPSSSADCEEGCQLHCWAIMSMPCVWLMENEPTVIAHNVLPLSKVNDEEEDLDAAESWHEMADNDMLTIDTDNYDCQFSIESGKLQVLNFGNEQILGLDHCFYRSPTDNDKGGLDTQGGNIMPSFALEICKVLYRDECSYNFHWLSLGLNKLKTENVKFGKTDITENDNMPYWNTTEKHYGNYNRLLFETTTEWKFCEDAVVVHVHVVPSTYLIRHRRKIKTLPRIGLVLQLPAKYTSVMWNGLGPHENYNDRQEAAWYGVHSKTIDEMHTPYIVPGENGSRGGVKSVCLIDEKAKKSDATNSLHISYNNLKETKAERPKNGDKGAHFSVSRYSVDELANALHEEDLPPIDNNSDSPLYLHIDCAHMGVGGDNSWSPVTLDEYFIPPEEEWEYSITIRPMKVSV